jgi:glutathione S-transferase
MKIPQPLILYSRADCHLCDQVIMMLDGAGIHWRPVDVDGNSALLERYGPRIPVLRRPDTGGELFYPFDEQLLEEFARGGKT